MQNYSPDAVCRHKNRLGYGRPSLQRLLELFLYTTSVSQGMYPDPHPVGIVEPRFRPCVVRRHDTVGRARHSLQGAEIAAKVVPAWYIFGTLQGLRSCTGSIWEDASGRGRMVASDIRLTSKGHRPRMERHVAIVCNWRKTSCCRGYLAIVSC